MYVCIYMYTYVYICIHMYMYTYIYIYVNKCTYHISMSQKAPTTPSSRGESRDHLRVSAGVHSRGAFEPVFDENIWAISILCVCIYI